MLAAANRRALDETQPVADRAEAVRTLGLGSFAAGGETLTALLDNRHPQEIQLAVLETFGKFDDPAVGKILTEAWPRLSPRLRAAAGEVLFSRAAVADDGARCDRWRPPGIGRSWIRPVSSCSNRTHSPRSASA